MYPRIIATAATLLLAWQPLDAGEPATVEQAAELLDLVSLPLPEGAQLPGYRREAELHFSVGSPARKTFDFVDAQLQELGWEQVPGMQDYDQFVSAYYTHGDFLVYLSVSPGGDGRASVTVSHKGNTPPAEVPVPAGVEKLYEFPGILMYKSADPVPETTDACHKVMTEAGWSPYGGAGDVFYYRKNAVQADVRVMSAPAQGGATMINLSTHLLSLALPAPPFADDFRYTDGTTAIGYDCDKTEEESAEFYRQALPPLGWTATTDKPVQISWKKHTIFRNDAQDMITLTTHEFEARTRTFLDHQNVAEVADDELRSFIAFGEKAKYRDKKWLPVEVNMPAGVVAEQLEDWAIKAPVERGDAFAVAEQVVASLQSGGWSLDSKPSDKPHLRTYRLEGQERVLRVVALDPPKRDPWVAVVGIGGVKLTQ